MIRVAKLTDFDAITQIRKVSALNIEKLTNTRYRVEIQKVGFLLPVEVSYKEFQRDFSKYSVCVEKGQIIGYLKVDHSQEIKPDANIFWFSNELKQLYYSKPHTYLYGIGVLPKARNKGAASKMLKAAIKIARSKGSNYLFSLVVSSPVTNVASMLFHEKNGFVRIATALEPLSLFDPEQYQAIVYVKKLT